MWALQNTDIDIKIIKINRSKRDVVNSLYNRVQATKKKLSNNAYSKFYDDMWNMNLYHPSDLYVQDNNVLNIWNSLSDKEKLGWYWEETERQWSIQKEFFKYKSIDIEFNELFQIEYVERLSKFINLSYNKSMIGVAANK